MRTLNLWRIFWSPEKGTYGVLQFEGEEPFAVSLEPPLYLDDDGDSMPFISCIPIGEYECKKVLSPTFGKTFEVLNVPKRSGILFHWGNWVKDTKGCILVAEQFEEDMIVDSKHGGFADFCDKTEFNEEFLLKVQEV